MSLNSYIYRYSVARAGLCVFARTAYVNRMGSIKKTKNRQTLIIPQGAILLKTNSGYHWYTTQLTNHHHHPFPRDVITDYWNFSPSQVNLLKVRWHLYWPNTQIQPTNMHLKIPLTQAASKALSIFCRFVAFLMELTFPSVLLACRTMIYWPDLRGMLHCQLPTARRRREK